MYDMKSSTKASKAKKNVKEPIPSGPGTGNIVSETDEGECLDTAQLSRLEQSFRQWANDSHRANVYFSRQRILLLFLLIRYTAAKLNEVLALDPYEDMDEIHHAVVFHGKPADANLESRKVSISESLFTEIRKKLSDMPFGRDSKRMLNADPGFVRRKFYERAMECGFVKYLGGPEAIRKARAVELIQSNMPLPAVQMILGHSTSNLTSSYVSFSREDIAHTAKRFMEKESLRKSSARNAFFGKITRIVKGDIQTYIKLTTMDGHSITTVVTNDSTQRLALRKGRLITAEIKAPLIMLQRSVQEPLCSAENKLEGIIENIKWGKVNTECVVRLSETTRLCAVISTMECRNLKIRKGDAVWALFPCSSVVLHAE